MALELKTTIEESANASSFRIYDATTNWDVDGNIASGDVLNAYLVVISELYGTAYYDMYGTAGAIWTEFLSSNGHEVLIESIFPLLTGFPDDYYTFRLIINTDGSALINNGAVMEDNIDYENINTQGFMAYIREAARKLPLPLQYKDFNFEENRKIYQINILMEGAEADGAVGNATRFKAKMAYVSEQLNLKGISYGN